jgi:hypothetical protein
MENFFSANVFLILVAVPWAYAAPNVPGDNVVKSFFSFVKSMYTAPVDKIRADYNGKGT